MLPILTQDTTATSPPNPTLPLSRSYPVPTQPGYREHSQSALLLTSPVRTSNNSFLGRSQGTGIVD
ncbi:hypothetical protein E2C01_083051 [Portunus trituberculatus]|uniref:Uncharacterized protein n=1 Tax=Portunus trituberculatus TaxID=210409 RepID=A0A5B7J3H2_PORTR|nr:hypothetical protein [Portunus trituberculatus]